MFIGTFARRSGRAQMLQKLCAVLALPLLTALLLADTAFGAGRASDSAASSAPTVRACTAGPDYWQAYRDDPAWEVISPDAPFFAGNLTWSEALSASAPAGSVYHQLARQYVATRLNLAGGAEPADALEWALVWTERYFTDHTPSATLIRPDFDMARQNTAIFERYNLGAIGPGACGA